MAKASPQELAERRVKTAYNRYKEARARLNAHVEEHKTAFEEAYDLSESVNVARKRLEAACRENHVSVGPITVTAKNVREFNVDYVQRLAKDNPILAEAIKTKITVQAKVFDKLVQDGSITPDQAKKAVASRSVSYALSGVPDEIVLP